MVWVIAFDPGMNLQCILKMSNDPVMVDSSTTVCPAEYVAEVKYFGSVKYFTSKLLVAKGD